MVTALLLEARARDALGDQATRRARPGAGAGYHRIQRHSLLPFLLDPAPALLERHRRCRSAHPALISQILELLGGPGGMGGGQPPMTRGGLGAIAPREVTEQLTDSETRVLRYLPTHLTTHEIAAELFLSVNTVGTHRRHLYAKLGVHTRHEAVNRARALGLLAPSARRT